MPSTYSSSIRLELIGNGERPGTWGSATNNNLGALLEQAIAGVQYIDVTGGDLTLTVLNGAVDEARNAALVFLGAPAGPLTVTIPNVNKLYRVRNTTAAQITLKTALGTGYDCPPTSMSFVDCTGVGDGAVSGLSVSNAMAGLLKENTLSAVVSGLGAAPIASPTFTGTPQAPTAAVGTNTTQIATTAFVINNAVPSGFIGMWRGSIASIPTGWFLCNGANGTPNLQDLFIVGAGQAYAPGDTGGSKDAVVVAHSHTTDSSGAHAHSGVTSTDGTHQHSQPYLGSAQAGADNGGSPVGASTGYSTGRRESPVDPAGAHNHSVSLGGGTHSHSVLSTGVSGTNANLPPYYALAFIMKA